MPLTAEMTNYDMIVGARNAQSDSAWYRDVANTLFNRYASYVAANKILDLTSGFRVIRRERVWRYIELLPNGFSYPTTLTIIFFVVDMRSNIIPLPRLLAKDIAKSVRYGMVYASC